MRLSPQQVAMQRLYFRHFMHQHKRSIKKWTPWKWNKSSPFSLKMKKKCTLFSLRRCCPFFWNMASCTSQVADKKTGKKNTKVFTSTKIKNLLGTGSFCQHSRIQRKHRTHFLKKPDIPYRQLGKADTVYCGKNDKGDKVYKSNHYF